jgi:hypothetical protein
MPDILFKQDGQKVENFNKNQLESAALFDDIKQAFPWFDVGSHRAVSQAYVHEIIGKRVMRTCLMLNYAESIVDGAFGTAHRLFDLDTGTSMIYVTKLFEGDKPSWATDDMFILGQTEHHEEFKKPCDPAMLSFSEYFFIAADERLESMNFDLTDRNEDTLFSVLVSGDQVVAQRRYTNFDPEDAGVLANWQMMYVMFAKKARRLDLVRALFAQPYVHR